ncbi:winged helix-turn-helix domain-containing protein [Mesobacterium pallidum]|uniref:winged helix-turn-helix domain-containing protein n=1 Tax=Mesobacterium pallidum TaxID=2872037 RepID=UPI001EE1CC0A|nr:crosslink repair DNA glycosylase YcaQ family protein [Mesobacterium pallidum]
MARPLIDTAAARRLFLDRHALSETPSGPGRGDDLYQLIERLGFVQIDSINRVARAHDMILFARRPAYRPKHLAPLLERDRKLFEHWTHDASLIPTAFFPHWQLRFARDAVDLPEKWTRWQGDTFQGACAGLIERIREHGPVSSAEVGEDEPRSKGGWWDWHPSKAALEFLWRTGALSVTRREGFRKVYDLTDRVIPAPQRSLAPPPEETIDWACNAALDRLGFATSGELAAFWDKVTPAEAKTWVATNLASGQLMEVDIQQQDGKLRRSIARPDLPELTPPEPTSRMRILSPFDPALRDRKRAERLFGFHYRIEIFVPEPQRVYGYYVYPMLEGDRIIGRIDVNAERDADRLHVTALWPERGIRWGKGRQNKLESELDRMTRLAGVSKVTYEDGWLRTPR